MTTDRIYGIRTKQLKSLAEHAERYNRLDRDFWFPFLMSIIRGDLVSEDFNEEEIKAEFNDREAQRILSIAKIANLVRKEVVEMMEAHSNA